MFQTDIIEKSSQISGKLRNICGEIYDGDTLSVSFAGKPWADMRGVDDGALPEDGDYIFAALGSNNTESSVLTSKIQSAFDMGKSLIIKDSSIKPVRGRPNRNLVVVTPFTKVKL